MYKSPASGGSSLPHRSLFGLVSEAKSSLAGPIIRNAASLYGATVVTSFLGFIYWFLAARLASPEAVGIASAVQSAAQFISIFCVAGLSTLLISELAIDKSQARSLMLTAASFVSIITLIVGASASAGLHIYSSTLRLGVAGFAGISIFITLSVLTTVLLVVDDACIGLLRGDLQFKRNTIFAFSKLALLPLLIWAWSNKSGIELVGAWLSGMTISLLTLSSQLFKLTCGQSSRLNFKNLFEKRRLMIRHHWLNLSISSPRLILPVLVVMILGPQENAAFTAANLVVGFVNVIPSQLSTVLFALAPGAEADLHREVRKTMRLSLVVSLASAPAFIILAGLILKVFGRDYESAKACLCLLGLTTYPFAFKAHYVAIARVRGRMQTAAIWTMVGAALEIGLAAGGGLLYGLTGVGCGYLVAQLIEAILYSPSVIGVIRKVPEPEAGADSGDS